MAAARRLSFAATVVILIAACGPGLRDARRPDVAPSKLPAHARKLLLDVIAAKDVDTLAAMLQVPFGYNGVWFTDPECTRQFPQPAMIDADRIKAFARCMTTLTLREGKRSKLFDVAFYEYGNGIELEVRFSFVQFQVGVLRMGYSNRGTANDTLPTITADALETLRAEGSPSGPLTDEARATLAADARAIGHDYASAWMKLCIDATGNVSGVHFASATPPSAADIFGAAIGAWKFRPFAVAGKPIPVCAHVGISDPLRDPGERPLDSGGVADIDVDALKRISGTSLIAPADDEKILLQREGGGMLVGAFKLCISPTGAVTTVTMLESTGLRGYDALIERTIQTWRYQAARYKGEPITVCTQVTFIYSQPAGKSRRK